MKVVFVSNYFNHHQKPFSEQMYSLIGDGYSFIETAKISEERLKMGWGEKEKPSYVKQNFIDAIAKKECQELIDNADVVIYGSAPYELLQNRLKNGKLTFKYCERIYKNGCPYHKLPWHFILNTKKHRRYKNFYLLCASAYASADFAKTHTFINKAYKWGYFTQVKEYDCVDELINAKRKASILWVGRFIACKHPEVCVEIAKRLKANGYQFELNMIGNGELESQIADLIEKNDLSDCVKLLGAMKPERVREQMEQSQIFMFTSDKGEGWGAVLNESMNSACAVVASHAIGSVPFLVKDGENGLIYKDGDLEDLYKKVAKLLDDNEKCVLISKNAYETIINEWNADNASKKLISLIETLRSNKKVETVIENGICSKAEILKDNWF